MRLSVAALPLAVSAGRAGGSPCGAGQLQTPAAGVEGSSVWSQRVTFAAAAAAAPEVGLTVQGYVHHGEHGGPGPCCGNTFNLSARNVTPQGFDFRVERTDSSAVGWGQQLLLAWSAGGAACPYPALPTPAPPTPAPARGECPALRHPIDCGGLPNGGDELLPWPGAGVTAPQLCAERGCCWDGARCLFRGDGAAIDTVHVIQSSHLDVGYADLLAPLINKYFDEFFPRAARVGKELRDRGGEERLRWMTHSYLVSLYLDCPAGLGLHCPDAAALATFTAAAQAGDIWWAAFPTNAEIGLNDPATIAAGVEMTHAIDDQLGVRRRTTVSTRDVPGMDRSIIPAVLRGGGKMLSEGHNGSPWPVNMPPAFVWRDAGATGHVAAGVAEPSGAEIPVLWVKDYGEKGRYGVFPNSSHAVAYDWRGDNQGPPASAAEVIADWKVFRKAYPNARILASTFDEVYDEVAKVQHLLPVITADAGDTWIFGPPSDPKKVAEMRILQRHRTACVTDPGCALRGTARLANFTRLLMKNAEHTWGLSTWHYPSVGKSRPAGLGVSYSNAEFHAMRRDAYADPKSKSKWIKDFEDSWRDQRRFGVGAALEAIAGTDLAAAIDAEIRAVEDVAAPDPAALGYARCDPNASVAVGDVVLAFGGDGALTSLRRPPSAVNFAAGHLGRLSYRTMEDCESSNERPIPASRTCELAEFRRAYLKDNNMEYGKKNCTKQNGAASALTSPRLAELWCGPTAVLAKVAWPPGPHADYGAPEYAWVNATAAGGGAVELTYSLFNKTATRYAEAGLLGFRPALGGDWAMDKAGSFVSPRDVVHGGSRGLHAVLSGVDYRVDAATSLFVRSLDAAVVSWGGADPYPTPIHTHPDAEASGAEFVLFDNLWDTNYVFWAPYDQPPDRGAGHFRYRFRLELRVGGAAA